MISHDITYIKFKRKKNNNFSSKNVYVSHTFLKEKLNEIGLNLVDFNFDSELFRLIQNVFFFFKVQFLYLDLCTGL